MEAIIKAIESKKISRDQIELSVARVLNCKKNYATLEGPIDVTQVNGKVFDLISLDVASFGVHRYFTVYGYKANGNRVEKYFPSLDNSYNTLETLTFGEDFKNLTSVSFSAWGQQIDNVTFGVTAVPEPETYALMLAGLGLVGFAARRRQLHNAISA